MAGFPGYWVSTDGTVFGVKSQARRGYKTSQFGTLKPELHYRTGHMRVALYLEGKRCRRYVHVLVAKAFLDDRGECVMHLDDNPGNNRLENLRWGTHSENAQHREERRRQMAEWLRSQLDRGFPPIGFETWGDYDTFVEQYGSPFEAEQLCVGD